MPLLGVPSVSDPDPHGSAMILFGWILIQVGKNYAHKNQDSSFEVLDVSCES
jgi:hypothetical protein